MSTNRHSRCISLETGWSRIRTQPGAVSRPSELDAYINFEEVEFPNTVVSDDNPDAFDWWYKAEFPAELAKHQNVRLLFEGLATICEIWCGNQHHLTTRNMFRSYAIDLPDPDSRGDDLFLCFRSVTSDLASRRPRPSWKTNLVDHQQLRWIRTSLLGRIPSWTPANPIVGPYRTIFAELTNEIAVDQLSIAGQIEAGQCIAKLNIACSGSLISESTKAVLRVGDSEYPIDNAIVDGNLQFHGNVQVKGVMPWMPHTHGTPHLYDYKIVLVNGGSETVLRQGSVGFRSVEVESTSNRFAVSVNGTAIFCRGACWTTNDFFSLRDNPASLRRTLELMRDAGANIIRIGGTMIYESDLFHTLCDELGIMVWQDFMFANMDYPIDDPDFRHDVREEISETIDRLLQHPSTTMFCGNSEVEQQAAMFGKREDERKSELFYDLIPQQLKLAESGIPYVPSSPCFGDLPFHNGEGISHYFGVGAYKRPVDDVRNAGVLFTSECLGFSNFPDDATLVRRFGGPAPVTHTPAWKAGVPRDAGAGWDFEDIRDHYLGQLYRMNGPELRYYDKARYAALSKVVTGEVMQRTFSYWRGLRSHCGGGIVWFLKDLVPGAGWGIIDSDNFAKPVYYFLKRAWGPVSIRLTDNGLDGIQIGIVNEGEVQHSLDLTVSLLRSPGTVIAQGGSKIDLASGSEVEVSVDKLLGRFFDPTYTYRFGPPKHDVVAVTLKNSQGDLVASQCYFPDSYDLEMQASADLSIDMVENNYGTLITLQTDSFLQFAQLKARNWEFDDNYGHLIPGVNYQFQATRVNDADTPLRISLSAINLSRTLLL